MINVLLVDPCPGSLAHTQRTLYSHRHAWNLLSASTAHEALSVLSTQKIDAILATQDLPDVQGDMFVESVLSDHPRLVGAVRASSWKTHRQLIRKHGRYAILDRAHKTQSLIDCIDRAVRLSNTLSSENLIKFAESLAIQPPEAFPPHLFLDDLKTYENRACLEAEICEMLSLSQHEREVCNLSIEKVFGQLSPDVLRALYIRNAVCHQLGKKVDPIRLQHHHKHAVLVACLARNIMREEQLPRPIIESATVAGLLHNIGSIIFLTNFEENYLALEDYAREQKVSLAGLQRKNFNNITSGELGAYYLSRWGFETAVVEAVAYHNMPTLCPVYDVGPLLAVHVSNALVTAKSYGALQYAALSHIDRHYIKATGTLHRLPIWEAMFQQVSSFRVCAFPVPSVDL